MHPRGPVSSFLTAFLLFALLLVPNATLANPTLASTRITCQAGLSRANREDLALKLQAITGWADLKFDKDGLLQLGARTPKGGSETARGLLRASLSHRAVLVLEDASKRKDVVFCRVVLPRSKRNDSQDPPVYVIQIDFADFDSLIGDRPALNAFDVGWGFLHELDHVINESIDSKRLGQIGACEDHINRMRRELTLPERADYLFTYFPYAQQSEFKTRFVRLPFDQKDLNSGKNRRFWLMWDAAIVGGLGESKQVAEFNSH